MRGASARGTLVTPDSDAEPAQRHPGQPPPAQALPERSLGTSTQPPRSHQAAGGSFSKGQRPSWALGAREEYGERPRPCAR